MAILDVVAQNAALDSSYGDDKGGKAPASVEVALFHGDPNVDGVELTLGVGGYARAVLTNNTTNFPDAADGLKPVPVAFADATDAFSDTVTHWQFYDHADGTTGWDNGKFANEINITGPGPVSGVCTVYYGGTGA